MNEASKSLATLEGVKLCLETWLVNPQTSQEILTLLQNSGRTIELPASITLPNAQSPLSHIFVRKAYLEVYKYTRGEGFMSREQLCVTGTPATGKSVLGVYCFFRDVLEAVQSNNLQQMAMRHYYSSGTVYLTVDLRDGQAPSYGDGKWDDYVAVNDRGVIIAFQVF